MISRDANNKITVKTWNHISHPLVSPSCKQLDFRMKNAWKATSAIGGKQIHSFGPKKRGSTGADSSISGDGINTTLQQLWCLHDSVRCVVETEMRSSLEAHLMILIFLDSLTSVVPRLKKMQMLLRMFYLSCELVCTWTQMFAPRITTKLDDRWRTYISPFPPNQSLQLILDLDDPNKINTSIFSAVSSCVLWRLRLPLVLLICNSATTYSPAVPKKHRCLVNRP